MAVTAKVVYPTPIPQPQPVEAALLPEISINIQTNAVVISSRETLLSPDGKRIESPEVKKTQVLLSDAQVKAFLKVVLTEAQAQEKLRAGELLTAGVG